MRQLKPVRRVAYYLRVLLPIAFRVIVAAVIADLITGLASACWDPNSLGWTIAPHCATTQIISSIAHPLTVGSLLLPNLSNSIGALLIFLIVLSPYTWLFCIVFALTYATIEIGAQLRIKRRHA